MAGGHGAGHGRLSAGEGRFDGALQFRVVERVVAQQQGKVEEVLHAGIGHAQHGHGMQLFGDDRGLWVGAQGRCGNVVQQRRVVDGLRRGRDGITEVDVDLQRRAGAVEPGAQIDAHAAVAGVLADRAARDRRGIEDDAVVHCHAGERSENAGRCGWPYQSWNSSAPFSRKFGACSEMDSR